LQIKTFVEKNPEPEALKRLAEAVGKVVNDRGIFVNNIPKESARAISAILKVHFPHAQIWLFGSRATGKNRPGSDIDIAIDEGTPIDFSRLAQARDALEESTIPYKVDLVDYTTVTTEFREEIKTKGVEWIF